MALSGVRRWPTLEVTADRRWFVGGLVGLVVAAAVTGLMTASVGLHPGFELAFGTSVLALLAWSALGLRAAIGEPALAHWRRLLEVAQVRGALCAVDAHTGGRHSAPALADLSLDRDVTHRHTVDPEARVALPFPEQSCDAVVFGPRIADIDEATRDTLLDEALRVLRPSGHVMLVVPTVERRGLLWVPPIEWRPGAPQGWWSDALGERFTEVRYARFSRRLDVVLATRPTDDDARGSPDEGPGLVA
jgi:hypothetical protein